jgi:transposase InsO family protein
VLKEIESVLAAWLSQIEVIQGDNGKEFKNKKLDAWAAKWNIKIVHPKARNPQADGLVEQVNGQMQSILKKLMDQHNTKDWPSLINEVTG